MRPTGRVHELRRRDDFLEDRFFPVSYSLVRVGESEGGETYDLSRGGRSRTWTTRSDSCAGPWLIDMDEAVTALLVDQKQLKENL